MENFTYADAFGILASVTDLKIDFFVTQPVVDYNGKVSETSQVLEQRVALSLPLAKNLSIMLENAIKNYEQNFGTIPDLAKIQASQQEKSNG